MTFRFARLETTSLGISVCHPPTLIKHMVSEKAAGNDIVTITAPWPRNPIRASRRAVPCITTGCLETITQHLACEVCERRNPRELAVAARRPFGHAACIRRRRCDVMQQPVPMGGVFNVKDITDAVMYPDRPATSLVTSLVRRWRRLIRFEVKTVGSVMALCIERIFRRGRIVPTNATTTARAHDSIKPGSGPLLPP